MKDLKWYCDASRDHLHESAWEAANCSELYALWQEALGYLMAYVREHQVVDQVNTILATEDVDEED